MAPNDSVGLVLSGGGARGAYEAGVLAGIVEALGAQPRGTSLFQVVVGTSVGAINGAWVVANAHTGDHDVRGLVRLWHGLRLEDHLRVDLLGVLGWASPFGRFLKARPAAPDRLGRSLLNPQALETAVRRAIDWPQLHDNVDQGLVRAFVVAALHVGTGATTLFTELAPGASFKVMRHPRRVARYEPIGFDHVMASAAIPALFPARRVGRGYFVDGGLRFNTPIAPAIRAGANKLVVITLRHDDPTPDVEAPGDAVAAYPSPIFLMGKIFNALLLDPVAYDLQILERFNGVMAVLDSTLSDDERWRIDQVLVESRGLPYRKIDTLVFEPSQNIGTLAGEHLREHLGTWDVGWIYEWLLAGAAAGKGAWEADLASYLLFDGSWSARLVELGRLDALAKRDEIRAFFGS